MQFGDDSVEEEREEREYIYPADMCGKLLIIYVNGHRKGIPVDTTIRQTGQTDALEVDIIDLSEEGYPTHRKVWLFQGSLIGKLKRHIGKDPVLVVWGREHPAKSAARRCGNPCQSDPFTVTYLHTDPDALAAVEAYLEDQGPFQRSEFSELEIEQQPTTPEPVSPAGGGRWIAASTKTGETPHSAPQAPPAAGVSTVLKHLSEQGARGAARFIRPTTEEPPF